MNLIGVEWKAYKNRDEYTRFGFIDIIDGFLGRFKGRKLFDKIKSANRMEVEEICHKLTKNLLNIANYRILDEKSPLIKEKVLKRLRVIKKEMKELDILVYDKDPDFIVEKAFVLRREDREYLDEVLGFWEEYEDLFEKIYDGRKKVFAVFHDGLVLKKKSEMESSLSQSLYESLQISTREWLKHHRKEYKFALTFFYKFKVYVESEEDKWPISVISDVITSEERFWYEDNPEVEVRYLRR